MERILPRARTSQLSTCRIRFKLLSCPDPSPASLLLLAEKSFSLKLLPDHLELCLLHRYSQKRPVVVLETPPPTMSWRFAIVAPTGTLTNDQQMTVSSRTAAVQQISPVQRKFTVSIPTSKRREWLNMPDIME